MGVRNFNRWGVKVICDWYQATISDNLEVVTEILHKNMGGLFKNANRGMNGYENKVYLQDELGNKSVTILYGSKNKLQQLPHIFATGDSAIKLREICHEYWKGKHAVTRIDVAHDVRGVTAFDDMTFTLMDYVENKNKRVKSRVVGDWLSEGAKDGRTLYLGSPTSSISVRLYEKGKQLANERWISRGFEPPDSFPLDWVRFEVQCRPKGNQRIKAGMDSLEAIWGYSAWTKVVAQEIMNLKVDRVSVEKILKVSNDEDVMRWVVKQYGKLFVRRFRCLNSWESVGLELQRYISEYINSSRK